MVPQFPPVESCGVPESALEAANEPAITGGANPSLTELDGVAESRRQ